MNFLTELIILLIFGIAGGFLVKFIKLPSVVGYIFGGILFSIFFGLSNSSSITDLSRVGITLLLFAVGIDFSIDKLLQVKKYALFGGIIQIVLTIIFGFLLFQVFRFDSYQSLFLGAVFSLSSTAIISKILEENNDSETFAGQISIGWLIVQDIAVVIIVLLLSAFSQSEPNIGVFIESILKSIVLILLSLIVGRKVIPRILTTMSKYGSRELLIIMSFSFALIFAFLSESFGISYTLGAFLAGLMISDSIYTHEIITEIKPFQIIFSMLFFITIGTLFSISFFISNIFTVLGVLIIGLSIKLCIILIINYFLKLNIKTSLKIGLSLSQIGEFSFLISQIAIGNNWINQEFASLILSATLISMILSPLLINNFESIFSFIDSLGRKRFPLLYRKLINTNTVESFNINELSNHIVICGYGKVGKYTASGIDKIGVKYIVIEMNDNEINISKPDNFIIGDASNRDILKAAKIEKAKLCIITMPKDSDINAIISLCIELNPDIKIVTRSHDSITKENLDVIHAIIEPEFETASKMLEKLLSIYRKRSKKLLNR